MKRRAGWILFALSPLAIAVASFFLVERFLGGRLAWLGYLLYAFGAFVSAVNFYLSSLRYALHRWRTGSTDDLRSISGIPLFGETTVVGLAFMPASAWTSAATILLMLINTASMFWFAVALSRDPSSA